MHYISNLLKKYINIQDSDENIAYQLSTKTCEIEEVITRKIPTDVLVGYVTKTYKHPDADKLTVCELDCWENSYQVCTWATNISQNIFVPVAIPGCYLPAIDLKIEPRKMRWLDSNWMICSKEELGLVEDTDHWIWVLDKDFELTKDDIWKKLVDIAPWLENTLFDVDNKTITNRPDLTGHIGLAIDLFALYSQNSPEKINFSSLKNIMNPEYDIFEILDNSKKSDLRLNVQSKKCNSYIALSLDNIFIKPSSLYLKTILGDLGLSPRNNFVDFSNYFMYLTSQPVHFFDKEKISWTLTVRQAKNWEKFVDLFDWEHELLETDMVIADDEKILALAWVVWWKDSWVSENTKNIVVEIANFDSIAVRKTWTRLGLRTDAELRYEKNISPLLSLHALVWMLDEIKSNSTDLGNPEIAGLQYYVWEIEKNKTIDFDEKTILQEIFSTQDNIWLSEKILWYLWFQIKENKALVPYRRWSDDMNILQDLTEEVARVYGYDNIASKPYNFDLGYASLPQNVQLTNSLVSYLPHLGYVGIESYPWVSEKILDTFGIEKQNLKKLQNPVAPELKHLKPLGFLTSLDAVKKNSHEREKIKLFDLTGIFEKTESQVLDMLIFSKKNNSNLTDILLELKSDLTSTIENLGYSFELKKSERKYFHPSRQADIFVEWKPIGFIWQIHPLASENLDIAWTLVVAEINLTTLAEIKKTTKDVVYRSLQDQVVKKDFSFLIDKNLSYGVLNELLKRQDVENIEVFDIFEDEKLGDKKSISVSITYKWEKMDATQTQAWMNSIIEEAKNLWANLR